MELDYKEIGRRVARRRKQLKLTQEFLAELVDVSPQYISHIEHARSIPSWLSRWKPRRMNFW